jgi:hypothetical protein
MASKPPSHTQVQYRSAKTGEFTSQRVAERSPNTHVREVNKVSTPAPKKK